MRVPILSACCAALTLAALPAAAHGWSSGDDGYGGGMERNCPIVQPTHSVWRHPVAHGVHRHARGAGCPVAMARPVHHDYQRVFTRNDHDWSYEDRSSWRRDRKDWSDGGWSGRMADRGSVGCHDANGPGAYRDLDGGPRAAPDHGMRCHDGDLHREVGYAQASGEFGYSREAEQAWSSSERRGWSGEEGWSESASMTDRYGFLTWPGKTHFRGGQPMSDAPDIGPQAPPQRVWQVHP